ncbi:MAG: hypothetical protein R6U36_05170 [Candidatus Fermentibacteraceae bacterium]
MRIFAAVALLALAGAAFGGYSLGFKQSPVPYYVSDATLYTEGMPMLRFGAMVSPAFRMEGLLAYDKLSYEEDPGTDEYDMSTWAIGGSGYYLVADPANTEFSFGGQIIYAKTSSETDGVDGPETSAYSISPLMRIDFAIPGAERFALFTEFGIHYYSATTTTEGGEQDIDETYSGYRTYAPENILAGAYYIF